MTHSSLSQDTEKPVLVLDLDGTCIYTDTFQELLVRSLFRKPWLMFQALWWLIQGNRAFAKQRLTESISLNPKNLPYNKAFLREAYKYAQQGYRIVLATGTYYTLAEDIAQYLGFIDEVIATSNNTNMTGCNKAYALISRYGEKGFIYAGDSRTDMKVWPYASDIWVVNPKLSVATKARRLAPHPSRFRLFHRGFSRLKSMYSVLDPKACAYNLLILIPIFFFGVPLQLQTLGAFFMLNSITAGSATFKSIIGLNTEHRRNPDNPFVKGHLSPITGLIITPTLLLVGLTLSLFINPALLMPLVLWIFLLLQEDPRIAGAAHILGPMLVGCLV